MAILIRTSDVPPGELRDAWRAVVCDTLGPLDFRSDPAIPLRGEIAAGQLGPVNVGRVETSTPHSGFTDLDGHRWEALSQLDGLVSAGRRAEAVELFLVRAAEASPQDVAGMRDQPSARARPSLVPYRGLCTGYSRGRRTT